MLGLIKDAVVDVIFRFEPRQEPTVKSVFSSSKNYVHNKVSLLDEKTTKKQPESTPRSSISSDKKVGRNDTCPCGSGKKYKKCCGR